MNMRKKFAKSESASFMAAEFLIILFTICIVCHSCAVVKVENGQIAGTTSSLANGKLIHSFLGVPYAVPPVGKYRFVEPQTPEPWTGIWNATTFPSMCIQYSHLSYNFEGEEDCLYLNIFTPLLPSEETNPSLEVIFFIHGGAFMFGEGAYYTPNNLLLEDDAVLVFVSYRLGPFGFLSTGDDLVPGNNGLKDQVAALAWVQRNIVNFGGNPNSVTISGLSAGGASVHYHFLSPITEGLFHKGISFSGTVLSPWTLPKNNTDRSLHLAALVGCPTISTREMVDCLRRRPTRQILAAGVYFQPWRYSPFTSFGPVVEPAHPNAFLSEDPLQLLVEGRFKKLPWLISLNKDEGLYPAGDFIENDGALKELDDGWDEIAPHLFFYNYSIIGDVEKIKISQAIRKFYLGDESISKKTAYKVTEALGHRIFYLDIIRAAKLQAVASVENVYCYMFNYRGKYSLSNVLFHNDEDHGVCHGDDTLYLFNIAHALDPDIESDSAVASFLCSKIMQFVKTGNPSTTNVMWEPLSKDSRNYLECLHINSTDIHYMGHVAYDAALEFWKSILPLEYTDVSIRTETVYHSCAVVEVENGQIAGTTFSLASGKLIHAFLGVPYAVPPVGKYRFKEPQTAKPWTGIWNATTFASICTQYSHGSYVFEGEEDCLYLNIFTPVLPDKGTNASLEVLFFIHGGAFMFGGGTYFRADYMLQEDDAVFVFINYRLGPFGFLSTGDHVVPGNNGLKDQVAALEWVQRNIINFGGNPSSVTISGCSAGGASVHYHFLSPTTEGLFHKGISFSGTVPSPWTLPKNNTDRSLHLAALVGCPTTSTREMVNCLRRRPTRQILAAALYFQPWRYCPFTSFGPVVEPAHPNAFLSEDPLQLLAEGRFKKLPWLISLNKDEGLYPAADFIENDGALIELEAGWDAIAPHLFFYNYSIIGDVEKSKISQAIRKFYLGDESISRKTAYKVTEALGHRLFFLDIIRTAKLHAVASVENVYCYMFNYRGKYSLSDVAFHNEEDHGVSHADDTFYLFYGPYPHATETESDLAVVSFMCSIILQFMKTGNPSTTNVMWEPLSKDSRNNLECLHVNSTDTLYMGHVSFESALEFWRSILPLEFNDVTSAETVRDEDTV